MIEAKVNRLAAGRNRIGSQIRSSPAGQITIEGQNQLDVPRRLAERKVQKPSLKAYPQDLTAVLRKVIGPAVAEAVKKVTAAAADVAAEVTALVAVRAAIHQILQDQKAPLHAEVEDTNLGNFNHGAEK